MKVLVYIPCHSDFDCAVLQAQKVKNDFDFFKGVQNLQDLRLNIILSVNAYQPSQEQIRIASEICSEVITNSTGYMGDINISNGFIKALETKPDILWLLSANDDLVSNAIGNILIEFVKDKNLDLLVTSLDRDETFTEYQVIDPNKTGFSYGLISGVVYKLDRLMPFLHNGPFMAWTGWSQLTVIQNSMDSLSGLRVKALPFELVYRQRERELGSAGKHYAHSVFGMLILGVILKKNKRAARKSIRKYIFTNFYSWHLFSRRWNYSGQIAAEDHYLAWNQIIAEALIFKKTPVTYFFYQFFKTIPFENLSKINFVISVKRKFDKTLGQSKHYKNE
jgi:hypothetical protein